MLLQKTLAANGLALLLSTTVVTASPIELFKELLQRAPPTAMPESANEGELRWQPVLDFDKDGCYNTPAIDAAGNIAQGEDNNNSGGQDGCRDSWDLDNNNVYVRSRCNNNWCAYLYAYYFEKDVGVEHVLDAGGHRHDWEHIAVFVEGGAAQFVAASQHGGYETRGKDDVRWEGERAKIVYHKDGGLTHAFRFAAEADDGIENHRGVWFRGALIGYDGYPNTGIRDSLFSHDFDSATLAIKDDQFKANLDKASGGRSPGFDTGFDQ